MPETSRKEISLVAVVAAFSCVVHATLSQYAYDDAFIHMRIARNWVEHGAPYFNPGEPVMGTSSPLWTAVLALLCFLRVPLVSGVSVLNSVFFAAAVLQWESLVRTFTKHSGTFFRAVYLVTVASILLPASVGLMETSLAMFLLGRAIQDLRQKKSTAFFWFTLASSTRPELCVFYFVALLWNLRSRAVSVASMILQACIVGLPAIGGCLYYFGTIIPHPIIAKHIVYQPTRSEWVYVLMEGLFGDAAIKDWHPEMVAYLCVCFLWAALAIAKLSNAMIVALAKKEFVLVVVLPALGIVGTYGAANALVFPWYAPLFVIPLASGMLVLASNQVMLYRAGAAVVLAPFLILGAQDTYAAVALPQSFRNAASGQRVREYLRLAMELSARCPKCSLLGPEIGALGFGFSGKVIDAEGLVTPEALQWHPMTVGVERESGVLGAVPPELVRHIRPDVVIGIKPLVSALLKSEVLDSYRMKEISHSVKFKSLGHDSFWLTSSVVVLVRKDIMQLDGWPDATLFADGTHK